MNWNKIVGIGGGGEVWQGNSVSISADGNTAIIGGYQENLYQGASWIFSRIAGSWSQQGNKLVGITTTTSARQGWSVSLSSDGNTAIIGGYRDNAGQGAAWIFVPSNTLSTKLLYITATQKGSDVHVNFSTANETEMRNYEIEESSNGINFIKGISVAAKNANSNNYSCLASHVVMGNNYYRIKAIENNGKVSYSQIVKLKIGSGKAASISVYPNPVKDGVVQLQLSDIEQGEYTIRIINIAGKEFFTKVINHLGGSSIQNISIKEVPKGTYILQVLNNKTLLNKKIIVN